MQGKEEAIMEGILGLLHTLCGPVVTKIFLKVCLQKSYRTISSFK